MILIIPTNICSCHTTYTPPTPPLTADRIVFPLPTYRTIITVQQPACPIVSTHQQQPLGSPEQLLYSSEPHPPLGKCTYVHECISSFCTESAAAGAMPAKPVQVLLLRYLRPASLLMTPLVHHSPGKQQYWRDPHTSSDGFYLKAPQ